MHGFFQHSHSWFLLPIPKKISPKLGFFWIQLFASFPTPLTWEVWQLPTNWMSWKASLDMMGDLFIGRAIQAPSQYKVIFSYNDKLFNYIIVDYSYYIYILFFSIILYLFYCIYIQIFNLYIYTHESYFCLFTWCCKGTSFVTSCFAIVSSVFMYFSQAVLLFKLR